jgi:hypothetical protein
MTYSKAYKTLNQSGTIDNIINEQTNNGENLNIVKAEIIDCIKCFLQFVTESGFKGMRYWWNKPENMHQRIAQTIFKELATYQLQEIEKDKEAYQYMIRSLNLISRCTDTK